MFLGQTGLAIGFDNLWILWQTALETGRFAAAIDLAADYFDDPTIQLARYISRDLSPINHSGHRRL